MKRKYEKPSMVELDILMEDGFMAGSVFEPETQNQGVHIDGHQVGDEFDYSQAGSEGWVDSDNTWD